MSDKELQEVIDRTVEACAKKSNGNGKWLIRGIWSLILVLVVSVGGWIYNYGLQEQRLRDAEKVIIELKEAQINPTDWKYNDYFTRYLWAERWSQTLPDPPYNTRGVAPNL